MPASPPTDPAFPCSLTLTIPLPTHRLALTALRALRVDAELSPLVRRSLSLTTPSTSSSAAATSATASTSAVSVSEPPAPESTGNGIGGRDGGGIEDTTVLLAEYKATTNRMLRVAVNGFMESLGVVVGVMGSWMGMFWPGGFLWSGDL
ncbi:MAG: hypothetical protein FRX48_09358 [Lasallia pustulata]|uniref:Uncharacterized protein n=1 Tax=Lasallia pustulata TaxID=136370 RepID=A0A5M8PD74_9LECA|nr:MAG: hypothetical protein FRX48_09358 [Lasallia pustulata]